MDVLLEMRTEKAEKKSKVFLDFQVFREKNIFRY